MEEKIYLYSPTFKHGRREVGFVESELHTFYIRRNEEKHILHLYNSIGIPKGIIPQLEQRNTKWVEVDIETKGGKIKRMFAPLSDFLEKGSLKQFDNFEEQLHLGLEHFEELP